ncbi:hypothetical protein [Demequina flava]|uniref:hypothetical protein n=1 Tax=Demequina flava TaxID=1095025 RepID=UPI0007860265|nr:hypothetical protein [Demequina flava]
MLTTRLTIAGGATIALTLLAGCSSSDGTAESAADIGAGASAAAEDIGEAVEEALDDATTDEDSGGFMEGDGEEDDDAMAGESGPDTATVEINGETYNFAIPEGHDGLDAQCLALDGSFQGVMPFEGSDDPDTYFSFALVDWDAVSDAEAHNDPSMNLALPDGTEWVAGEQATWFGLDPANVPVDLVPSFDDAGAYASGTITLQMVPELTDLDAEDVFADATVEMACLR